MYFGLRWILFPVLTCLRNEEAKFSWRLSTLHTLHKSCPTHIIAFHDHDSVQRIDPDPAPEIRNLQKCVTSGGQPFVSEELLEALVRLPAQSTLLSTFKA